MTSTALEHAVQHYQDRLTALEKASTSHPSPKLVMDVLFARDAVETSPFDKDQDSSNTLSTIIELDKRLKNLQNLITNTVDVAECRQLLKRPAKVWWWRFPPPVHPWDRLDWLWGFLTAVFIAVSLSFAANIAPRFWAGGPSTEGALTVIGPSLLSLLLGGGALTQALRGRETLEKILENSKVPKHLHQEMIAGVAFIFFVGMWGFNSSLPEISTHFNKKGEEKLEKDKGFNPQELASAESDFKQAIAFNPNNGAAHYNLGWLYERRQDLDKAQTQYEIAMQNGSLIARIRLARLYIIDDKKRTSSNTAVALLLDNGRVDVENTEDKQEKYVWHKTLSWARLKQKRYEEALTELDKAIKFQEQIVNDKKRKGEYNNYKRPSAPFCLKALILEGQQEEENKEEDQYDDTKIESEWEKCNHYSGFADPDEDAWKGIAKQRLNKE